MYLNKRLLREWEFFYNHWIFKFLKISIFQFPIFKFIDFKITTNSFIYSLVEQFLETHFHKNNYRGKGILLEKIWQNFRVYIPLTWSVGYIIRATKDNINPCWWNGEILEEKQGAGWKSEIKGMRVIGRELWVC